MPSWRETARRVRDPSLPGLGLVLDPDAFAGLLSHAIPDVEIRGARVTYIRYKPGTNCLVGYAVDTGSGTQFLYAKAQTPAADVKLRKAVARPTVPSLLGPGRLVFPPHALTVSAFPNDDKLPSLQRVGEAPQLATLTRRLGPAQEPDGADSLAILRYKPERRCVAELRTDGAPRAVLRLVTAEAFPAAERGARAFRSRGLLRIPRVLGKSSRHGLLGMEWLTGTPFGELVGHEGPPLPPLHSVGVALATLHRTAVSRLGPGEAPGVAPRRVATSLATLLPELAGRIDSTAERLAALITSGTLMTCPTHGDFHPDQVLLSGDAVAFLDFDQAAFGNPVADLGNFLAHLERAALEGVFSAQALPAAREALLQGYQRRGGRVAGHSLALHTAAGLFRLLPEPFRRGQDDWPARTCALLDRAEQLLGPVRIHQSSTRRDASAAARSRKDSAMPFLEQALQGDEAGPILARRVSRLRESDGTVSVRAAHLLRWKPGRRCLIGYELGGASSATVLGKARSRGTDHKTHDLVCHLWRHGFSGDSADGVSVPEPLGVVPEFRMWLQRAVGGATATALLAGPDGEATARRIAEAVFKLHRTAPLPTRTHGPANELRILADQWQATLTQRPEWQGRLRRLLDGCTHLAAELGGERQCGIHRDFYPDQVQVDGERVHLLDLDLFCAGDPALDLGNFAAHLIEQGLRTCGRAAAFEDRVAALVDRYLVLAGGRMRRPIEIWTTLSLARHIALATVRPDRAHVAPAVLDLCEERLGVVRGARQLPARQPATGRRS